MRLGSSLLFPKTRTSTSGKLLLVVMALVSMSVAIGHATPELGNTTWVLTWTDDFNGTAINTTNWNVANNYTHGDLELELYTGDEVYIEDDCLVLRTQKRNATDVSGKHYSYTSGWVDTLNKVNQTFGKFEVRAKLPNLKSTGIWPAHWLMPAVGDADLCWPVGGEIDIMEQTANPFAKGIAGTLRQSQNTTCCCGDNVQVLPGAMYPPFGQPMINFTEDFHVFSVEWNSTTLAWAVDGNVYETRVQGQHIGGLDDAGNTLQKKLEHVKESTGHDFIGPGGGYGAKFQKQQRQQQRDTAVGGLGFDIIIPQIPFYWILNTAIAFYWPPGEDALYPVYHVIDWVRMYEAQ
eukprot:TRINITY_DN15367_c0_g1_i1.p1 TRINITY_DN15367_c0_g1~~TRINITY_DN15367_c0_g1_i1.p1  ORF type:complete len:349 (+),score=51.04 TRINITY_DN15367_c0_g1_i1:68-1114(+)